MGHEMASVETIGVAAPTVPAMEGAVNGAVDLPPANAI